MAADLIRVRLHFDYAPPAAVGSRMCWLLVDRGSCRVVADLESLIREKFELSRGSILSLFIDDCYLPHTESVLLVRDNDCVRVKVETVSKSTKQTSPVAASENSRKRQRPVEDDAPVESGLALELKKKKRKKSAAESPAVNGVPIEVEKTQVSPQKKNKKKKTAEEKRKSPQTIPPKPSPSVKKPPKTTEKVVKGTKKPPSSSSSSSSSSEDEQPVKKAPAPKLAPKPSPTPASAKTITNGRPPLKKLPPPTSSSSSETDSSSEDDEEKSVKTKSTEDNSKCETAQTPNIVQASNGAENSDEEEIELVIKKPVQHPRGRIVLGQQAVQLAVQLAGRGRGKDKQAPREPWAKGRGNCVQYNYNKERARDKVEASHSTDTLTNVSVLLQNGVKNVPKPDYSAMPLLAAPPQVGQKIAFKLLELTENYTPEVSDYKEAKILSYDPTSKQIELELQTYFQAPVEPGKFDLVYVNADGSESVEYAVDRGSLVTERWDSLLEPRLVI